MMLETDVLFAHLKERDWLKDSSEAILRAVDSGRLKTVYASRESLHELYYLISKIGIAPDDLLRRVGALTMLRNILWFPTTTDNDLLALSLVSTYKLTSVFDAYHAAACLLGDPEQTILSTDEVYDKIPRIKRIDPRDFAKRLEPAKR